ncbi:MAG TPA: hypothetical protein VH640_17280 [Bryobacteraceae bacterium]
MGLPPSCEATVEHVHAMGNVRRRSAHRSSSLRPSGRKSDVTSHRPAVSRIVCGKLTVVIPYFPIRDEALKKIIGLKLGKIQKRLAESHKVQLTYSEEVLDEIANRCTEVESGARNVDNILTNTLLPELSMLILGRIAQGQQLESVRVQIGPAGEFVYS